MASGPNNNLEQDTVQESKKSEMVRGRNKQKADKQAADHDEEGVKPQQEETFAEIQDYVSDWMAKKFQLGKFEEKLRKDFEIDPASIVQGRWPPKKVREGYLSWKKHNRHREPYAFLLSQAGKAGKRLQTAAIVEESLRRKIQELETEIRDKTWRSEMEKRDLEEQLAEADMLLEHTGMRRRGAVPARHSEGRSQLPHYHRPHHGEGGRGGQHSTRLYPTLHGLDPAAPPAMVEASGSAVDISDTIELGGSFIAHYPAIGGLFEPLNSTPPGGYQQPTGKGPCFQQSTADAQASMGLATGPGLYTSYVTHYQQPAQPQQGQYQPLATATAPTPTPSMLLPAPPATNPQYLPPEQANQAPSNDDATAVPVTDAPSTSDASQGAAAPIIKPKTKRRRPPAEGWDVWDESADEALICPVRTVANADGVSVFYQPAKGDEIQKWSAAIQHPRDAGRHTWTKKKELKEMRDLHPFDALKILHRYVTALLEGNYQKTWQS
ncbi:uncharacterized protein LOC125288261 isoform X2 [Alosa alosa]|uniref:uncharacterized protein LOC125288261 isoform X2 n=1 Tax=Alosa alosa TaxID=278164 RepID=UPI0020151211|nr:uncharacterized protein LOC125288261 isoform X2 [Alosa alosa]